MTNIEKQQPEPYDDKKWGVYLRMLAEEVDTSFIRELCNQSENIPEKERILNETIYAALLKVARIS